MSSTTTNMGLTKPAYTDPADIQVLSNNFQKIDDQFGTLSGSVATNTNSILNLSDTDKWRKEYRPIYYEQFFRTWYGRGQLTAEASYETIAGTTNFSQSYIAGTASAMNVNDASKFLQGAILAVEYDDGTHDTYFVNAVSGNSITLLPPLKKAVTTNTKIQRAWYNRAHANDFALKYIGEQLANATYDQVVHGQVIQEFNMNEPNILQYFKKMGGATISTQAEASEGANYGSALNTVSNQAIAIVGYANGDGYRTIDIPVASSSKIQVNLWLRANNTSNVVNVRAQDGTLLATLNIPSNLMYQPFNISVDIPYTVSKIYLEFTVTATATVGIYIDDIVISYKEKEGYVLPRNGKILMLFDSWGNWYTYGIQNQLQALLPNATIINKGIGGNTATDMLNRFDTDVAPNQPDVVICDTGVNDAYAMASDDTTTYIQNLKKIVAKCRAIGAVPLFMGLPALAETDPSNASFTQWQLTTRTRKMAFDARKSMHQISQVIIQPKPITLSIPQQSLASNAQINLCLGTIPNGGMVRVKSTGLYQLSANVQLQVGLSTDIGSALLGTANLDDLTTTNFYQKNTTTIDYPEFYIKNNAGGNRFLIVRIVNTDVATQNASGYVNLDIS